jgi:hypothetical protein
MDEKDAELLEAILRRHTDPSVFLMKGMESLKKTAEEPLYDNFISRHGSHNGPIQL